MSLCALPTHAQVAGTPAPSANASDAASVAKPVGDTTEQSFAIHAQATFVVQGNPAFHAAFAGDNSLRARGETRETTDFTIFAGVRPWRGAELWISPEIDQGFGLSNTLGAAGFPSGEAYKIGKKSPYFRLQRLFFRQTIGFGGEREDVAADQLQLGGSRALNP